MPSSPADGLCGSALSFFYVASPVGSALGVAIAGVLAGIFGWRSACDDLAADQVAAHLQIFDHVLASDEHHNLKGTAKLAAIRELCQQHGFAEFA